MNVDLNCNQTYEIINAIATQHDKGSLICYGCFVMLRVKIYKKFMKNPIFSKHISTIKRNRQIKMDVPYDEKVFKNYIYSIQDPYRPTFVNYSDYAFNYIYFTLKRHEVDMLNSDGEINVVMDNLLEQITICAMLCDNELAYTYFIDYKPFLTYSPFIEHKKNHEERKERFVFLCEELFETFKGGNVEMVFCNEYLMKMVCGFL